jgi:hypothetical protein
MMPPVRQKMCYLNLILSRADINIIMCVFGCFIFCAFSCVLNCLIPGPLFF